MMAPSTSDRPLDIAIIGTGIAGMAAAWLLSPRHRVTVYERAGRLGGHSNSVRVDSAAGPLSVDTGFIVYNEATYPNLTALFDHLEVATKASEMSFAVSLDDGALEYAGTDLRGLFAQRRNLVRPRFWSMLRDIRRFYATASGHAGALGLLSLGDYLAREGYGRAFQDDHLLPMAAAIWSAPARTLLDHPAAAFIRFCDNHGLLKVTGRPVWRTVAGGSRAYVERLTRLYAHRVRLGRAARRVTARAGDVRVMDDGGAIERFDHVVIAAHADQALAMLDDPTPAERAVLGAFRYSRNRAVLHRDPALMPRRRAVWSSWTYLGRRARAEAADQLCVTYWMNRLQRLPDPEPLLVTLNPIREPRGPVLHEEVYEHPVLDAAALTAQRLMWSLQGRRGVWFCGAYFGAGFHEDGLQAGLAVAEQLGAVRRPWAVPGESDRIVLAPVEAAVAP